MATSTLKPEVRARLEEERAHHNKCLIGHSKYIETLEETIQELMEKVKERRLEIRSTRTVSRHVQKRLKFLDKLLGPSESPK